MISVSDRPFSFSIAILMIIFSGCGDYLHKERELSSLTGKIDMELYRQSEADIRAWLDEMIAVSGNFGVYPDHISHVSIGRDSATVRFGDGWPAEPAAMFFRAWEMLGDRKYLDAGLRFCDFLLKARQPEGHFPASATIYADGSVSASDDMMRLQDRYQYPYFALLLYAYRLSGETRYREAAEQNAELVFAVQNPLDDDFWKGPWPDELPVEWIRDGSPGETVSGTFGVRTGYAHNDYATYDAMRTMIMMYHLTGDERYIRRIEKLPQWLFDSQLGLGNVRGWNEEYGVNNEPVWARRFESTLIDPRNFNRFAGPMIIQFYAVTGNQAFGNLFRESVDWLHSVKQPPAQWGMPREPFEGEIVTPRWAFKYTYDGRAAYSGHHAGDYRDILETSPPTCHNDNVHLESMEKVYNILEDGGLDALRGWYGPKPVRYSREEYLDARIEAARRATDEEREVVLQALEDGVYYHDRILGNFLERVRLRIMKRDSEALPEHLPFGRDVTAGRLSQHVWRPNPGRGPYKPVYGWATWQYVWDVRLALGKIDPGTAARGGRGFEAEGPPTTFFEPWDVRGDWTTHALKVEDWLDIPLNVTCTPVTGVKIRPSDAITLRRLQNATAERVIGPVNFETKIIEPLIFPENASYRTMTWESSDTEIARVYPRMLDDVDPEAYRPVYRTEGEIVIVGVSPGTATVTVRTTDGHHEAQVEVRVVE